MSRRKVLYDVDSIGIMAIVNKRLKLKDWSTSFISNAAGFDIDSFFAGAAVASWRNRDERPVAKVCGC